MRQFYLYVKRYYVNFILLSKHFSKIMKKPMGIGYIINLLDLHFSFRFIAEETSAREHKTPDLTDAPTWIIDPIDGTCNFVHGIPITAISIAMVHQKEIVIGIIYNGVTKELFSARKGNGAHLNGFPIHVSEVKKIQNSVVGHEISLAGIKELREKNMKRMDNVVAKCQGVRAFGCAAMSLAYVAQGTMDAYHIDDMRPWDMAAGVLLVREAGGVVYAPDGGEFDVMRPDTVAASTEELCRELIELFKK